METVAFRVGSGASPGHPPSPADNTHRDAAGPQARSRMITHRAMGEGVGVFRHWLRRPAGEGGALRLRLPPWPGHVLWLFCGAEECHHASIGTGTLRFRSEPGLGLLLPPNTASEWQLGAPQLEVLELRMEPGWLAELARSEGLPAAAARPSLRLLRRDPQLLPLFRLFQNAHSAGGADEGFCGHWAVLVGQRLLRLPPAGPATAGPTLASHRLAAVKAHVAAKLASEISLADMAALAGISPAHFSRAFRQETGLSPYAWLLAERIAAAMRLLAETDLPMAQVARAVGFGTAAHFSTRFRRATGASPQQWRAARRD